MALPPTLLDKMSTAVNKAWCHTKHEIKTIQFVWTIHQFSSCTKAFGQCLESSIFSADSDAPKWMLRAYPKGSKKEGYCAVHVVLCSGTEVSAKAKLSLMNDKNEKVRTLEINKSYDQGQGWGSDEFVKLETLAALCLMSQDTLTILCEVNVVSKSVNISGYIPAQVEPADVKSASLCEDIGALYDSEQFCDVKLIAGGHELKAHKAILSVRSKVFAAMFRHPMKEQISNCITITDVQHEVLKEMLRFIYTDKVSNLDAMAEELLAVSDKYEITNLKSMCEESLRANVTVENAAYTLILADRHNAKELKSVILKFIAGNAKAVSLTEVWNDMKTSHPELIIEAFCIFLSEDEMPCNKTKK